jgi:hypothetical protein
MGARWAVVVLVAALLVATGNAWGADARLPVVIWPTLTPAGDAPAAGPLRRPETTDRPMFELAQELDATLRDAVQDLGFTLYVADPGPAPGRTRDEDLIARASSAAATASGGEKDTGTWVVSPRIESAGGGAYVVRLVAVPPKGRELRVRVETAQGDAVNVRGLVMLRDLLTPETAAAAAREQEMRDAGKGTTQGVMSTTRSPGRAVLAVNGALFGGFTGFSLASAASGQAGSNDVLYPLLALGTGIGIGAALLVADEWDLSTGDAWFLSAGGLWMTMSGLFIADGRDVQPLTDRYSWGVIGGFVGLGLATGTFAITHASMDDGDATITHSGGALGLVLGAATQWIDQGTTTTRPFTGMGYGAAIGVLGAGVLATQVTTSPSRVLLIDVGAGGGALVGAAAASPLVVPVQNQTPDKTRAWLSLTVAGSLAGGGLTWWLTGKHGRSAWLPGAPTAGILGMTPAPGTHAGEVPIYGFGWSGGL